MKSKIGIGPRTGILLCLAVLVGVEVGLGTLGGWGRRTVTVSDDRLGWRKLASQTGHWDTGVEEVINAHGYRDREWTSPSEAEDRPGLRVAVLGDSVAYGHRVPIEETLGRQLEVLLREEVSDDALVMNFSMPGYVFEQMARVWEDDVRPFRPDVLIVTINAFSARPMQYFKEGPAFPLRDFVLGTATYDFLRRGVLKDRGLLRIEKDAHDDEIERNAKARAEQSDRRMRISPFDREHEGHWREMGRRLEELARNCSERNCRLLLVSMPRLEDVLGQMETWTGEVWGPWCKERELVHHVDPLESFREEMAPLLDALEARKITAKSVWARFGPRRSTDDIATAPVSLYFFADPEHFSPRGHAFLAEVLADHLLALGEL